MNEEAKVGFGKSKELLRLRPGAVVMIGFARLLFPDWSIASGWHANSDSSCVGAFYVNTRGHCVKLPVLPIRPPVDATAKAEMAPTVSAKVGGAPVRAMVVSPAG